MSHYWNNFVNLFQDIDPSSYRGEHITVFGLGDKYKANQANKSIPFDEAYAESSDVYAITNKIARNAKTVPWKLEIITGDEIELVQKGLLLDTLNNPNKEQSREDLTEEALLHLLIGGNGYLLPTPSSGFNVSAGARLLSPQLTEIVPIRRGKFYEVSEYIYRIGGEELHIKEKDLFHMKYVNPTTYGIKSLYGLAPVSPGHLTYKGLLNNQTASTAIYDNQGAGGILTNKSDFALTPEEQEEQQKILDEKINGSEKTGQVIQSTAKVAYIKLGLDPSQMKLIEGKVLKMRDLCNIYDCPSTLFNDPANRVQSNMAVSDPIFWINAVVPNLGKYQAVYDRAIIQPWSKKDFPSGNSFYKYSPDYSGVEALQKDKKEEATKDKLVTEGIREALKFPITVEGKKIFIRENFDVSEDFISAISMELPKPPNNNA